MYLLSFFVTQIIIFQTHCLIDLKITESYFVEKNTKFASVFGCFSKTEQRILAKTLMLLNTRPVSILNINQPGIYENLKTTHRQIGVILDGDCPKSEEFLIACGHRKFFSVKHHWLITTSSISIVEKFNNVNLNINVDIHIAISNAKTLNWTIIDVYNPAFERGGTLNYTKVGYYNEKQGYNARSTVAKYWTRKNMTGVTFKTMATLPTPFEGTLSEQLNTYKNREINSFNRLHCTLLRFCSHYYNFSMDITTTKSWGYPTPNGSFDGMVGALQRKAIDFGCSPMFVRADRTKVIDYGRSVWSWKAGFIFRSPKDRTPIEIFLKPLSVSIWLITGLLAILSIIIFKIATTFERNKYHYNKETSWSLCTILTLGVFCQQGLPSTPNMSCGRIATISIFLLSVIIYQFYSASVVSNLLMKPTNKIKTIKDLLDSPLKVGAEDIIYTRDLFAHTKDKTLVQLYYKKIYGKGNTSHFLTAREGIDLVRKGGYAFHTEAAKVYPLIETTFSDNAICELNEVELFKIKDLYGSFQKGSPFRDMIETCLQRITERGILVREIKQWHPRKPECILSSQAIVTIKVGLDEFYPALLIFFIGMVISLTILIVEIKIKKMQDRKIVFVPRRKKEKLFPFVK